MPKGNAKRYARFRSICAYACAWFALIPAAAQSLNPTGSLGVHDPVLIKDGGVYYVFHTGTRIQVKTSPDLSNWTNAGSALTAVPAWHAPTVPENRPGDLWAPDVSFRNGAFWMYYSVSSSGSQISAIGLATRASLATGAWQDQGMVLTSATYGVDDNAIDPNAITDAEGNPWLAWGSWWDGIFLVSLDPRTGKPAAGAAPIRIAGRSGAGIEGSFLIYARGYYHLFTSWDKCCAGPGSTYNMRYGRSANVTGPYLDKAGKALTAGGGTLLSDGSGYPGGHNAVFAESGNYYLVYHVYDGRNSPASLQIRRLFFDAQAWPTLDPAAAPVRPRLQARPRPPAPGIGSDWSGWFAMLRGRKPLSHPTP
jgi:arabinan endo-1,5-alpha-L-arabinosidase